MAEQEQTLLADQKEIRETALASQKVTVDEFTISTYVA
jgi:hypothetical protein